MMKGEWENIIYQELCRFEDFLSCKFQSMETYCRNPVTIDGQLSPHSLWTKLPGITELSQEMQTHLQMLCAHLGEAARLAAVVKEQYLIDLRIEEMKAEERKAKERNDEYD